MHAAHAIRVQNLAKRYRLGLSSAGSLYDRVAQLASRRPIEPNADAEAVWALRDITFDVPVGHVLGVIGRNGSGKSTLMKILAKVTAPTDGWVEIDGRVGALLQVGVGFHPELSGRDNIYLSGTIMGMSRERTRSVFDEIVEFSEIGRFLDTPVKFYSGGMNMRLAFSVASFMEADIMLIDEVLAVGDQSFQEKSQRRMREMVASGRTILYVSHSLPAIRMLCDSAIVLDRGTMGFQGKTGDAIRYYEEEVVAAPRR
jgi:lipopolysaccharide transport system ATP-binding protein